MQYTERQWFYIQCSNCNRIFGVPRFHVVDEGIHTENITELNCPFCLQEIEVKENIVANEINPIGVERINYYKVAIPI